MTQVDNSTSLTTPELSTAELGELMRSVMDTAERLQSTHDALQGQVARLERELAEANAQLHRSRELASLGEMAAGIAHEIRNPLASIQLFAEVLSEDLADRPEQKDVCRKIDVSVRRMDAIVSDVLQFARESTVRFQVMPASSLLRGVVDSCDGLGTKVQLELGSDPEIRVDPSLMIQSIGNIVRNGIESMSELPESNRRLDVMVEECRMRCMDGEVRSCTVLRIEDRGRGIPSEANEKIFNPFYTTRPSGTGLGLAIAHRVVDAHGGHITVNGREGGGTQFEVCFPAPGEPGDTVNAVKELSA